MRWPLRRDPTKTPFGRELLSCRERWEQTIWGAQGIEEPNRLVLVGASTGATVALGGFGAHLVKQFAGQDAHLPTADGQVMADPIVTFANRLTHRAVSVEAAYRVATWALVAEMGAAFWRPNYELEMHICAQVFEFRAYEGHVAEAGEPVAKTAPELERAHRRMRLVTQSLASMLSAANDEPVDVGHPFLKMYRGPWNEQLAEGEIAARERIRQLDPRGVPVWDD